MPTVGLSVRLPGEGWTRSVPTDYPQSLSERWDNPDRTVVLLVYLNDEYVFEGYAAMRSFVESIVDGFQVSPVAERFQFSPPFTATEEEFAGYQALRIEGIGLDAQQAFPSDTRFIEHWFYNERGLYEIAAGAKLTHWDKGGGDQVNSILQSIQIEETP